MTTMPDRVDHRFHSDNTAGIHPTVMAGLERANSGYAGPSGDDDVTGELSRLATNLFGPDAVMFAVFNGTGGDMVALQAICGHFGMVYAPASSHILSTESTSIEGLAGIRVRPCPAHPDGTYDMGQLETVLTPSVVRDNIHVPRAEAVTLAQAPERAGLYSPQQLRQLAELAHRHGLKVHMDGARLAQAAASLNCSLAELTVDVGIDVLTLGATKLGALGAEAVVVLHTRDQGDTLGVVERVRKYTTQLASKQRFLSAQLLALLDNDTWLNNAQHANDMARYLAECATHYDWARPVREPRVSGVFIALHPDKLKRGRHRYRLRQWDTDAQGWPVVRLMCPWQTSPENIETLWNDLTD